MSVRSVTKTYLRLRIIAALMLIILAAITAHLVGHASQGQIAQKTEVTAALDKAQLSAAEIIINVPQAIGSVLGVIISIAIKDRLKL